MPKHSRRERRPDEPRCERMLPSGFQCNGPALKSDTICGPHKDADAKRSADEAIKQDEELARLRRWSAGMAGLTFKGMAPSLLENAKRSIASEIGHGISAAKHANLMGTLDAIDAELARQRETAGVG
jgi:hypothetical protein